MTCGSSKLDCKNCKVQSLQEIVKCYKDNRSDDLNNDLRYFTENRSPEDVLEASCKSITEDGNMHSHQRRIGAVVLQSAYSKLKGWFKASTYCTFDEIHEAIKSKINKLDRIGVLTIYDIALRVAFAENIKPECVYLHRGALEGARHLKRKGYISSWKNALLSEHDLPQEFGDITYYEIENLLCTCKHSLAQLPRAT